MKKKVCSILSVLLVVVMLCTACSPKNPQGGESTGGNTVPPMDPLNLAAYKILCADEADDATRKATVLLKNGLNSMCGVEVQTDTDFLRRGEEPPTDTMEILVGDTNRRTAVGLKKKDFQIIREGNRIYILAGSSQALESAVTFFLENYITSGAVYIADPTVCLQHGQYAAELLQFGSTKIETVKIYYSLTDPSHASRWTSLESSFLEATGQRPVVVQSKEEANVICEENDRSQIGDKDWGIVCENGKLYIIGGSDAQTRKAVSHVRSEILYANGECLFTEGVYSMNLMTKEEYYQQTLFEIYPEYSEKIGRDYLYSVTVSQGDKSAKLPVYNHEMHSSVSNNPNCGMDSHRRFSTFAFSGEAVRIDIKVNCDFDSYSVLPSAKDFRHEFHNGVISVWMDKPEYLLIRLDDQDDTILAVIADYPEFPDEVDFDDPNTIKIEGWYENEKGYIEITEPGTTLYIAPGAVMNARVFVSASNVRILGRGAIVDPFENFLEYYHDWDESKEGVIILHIRQGADDVLVDGVFLLDAQDYNIGTRGKRSVIRNVKVLSTFICSDGITTYIGAEDILIEHCYVYCGDNALVFTHNSTYRDILVGTTCAAIYLQDAVTNVLLEDIHVFRADGAVVDNIFNMLGLHHAVPDILINRIDTVDCTYTPLIFRGQNMGTLEKNVTIKNLSMGDCDAMRTGSMALVENTGSYLYTDNYRLNFVNFAEDGRIITSVNQLDLDFRDTTTSTCTYSTEAGFTPIVRRDKWVYYKAPAKVYIGSWQIFFDQPVLEQNGEILVPYEMIKEKLRADKTGATVDVNGVAYIKASVLASSGMCQSAAIRDGSLYLTPNYNGKNLLLPDSGEISHYARSTSNQLISARIENGKIIYRAENNVSRTWVGLRRSLKEEVNMYGTGTYKFTFTIKADANVREKDYKVLVESLRGEALCIKLPERFDSHSVHLFRRGLGEAWRPASAEIHRQGCETVISFASTEAREQLFFSNERGLPEIQLASIKTVRNAKMKKCGKACLGSVAVLH